MMLLVLHLQIRFRPFNLSLAFRLGKYVERMHGLQRQIVRQDFPVLATDQRVLNDIEQQANVNFTYSSQKIAIKQSVSISAADERLEKVLEQLFSPVSIDYKVFNDRTIVLTKNNSTGNVEIEKQAKQFVMHFVISLKKIIAIFERDGS